MRDGRPWTGPWHALATYFAVAIAATWPLVLGLGRDVPGRLGEPLVAMWALAWDCEQLMAAFAGDLSRLTSFFDANIFHPAPLALAYSQHVIGQSLQILPLYAATRNPILCYNVLFLSTFVLSGLGTYLLVRELTGRPAAALFAGLLFAFAPYRLTQVSHLDVLSSHWMPFVLYGVRRYFDAADRRPRATLVPLAGTAGALAMLGLSSVDYLAYFTPAAAAVVAWEIASRRAWRRALPIVAAGAIAVAVALPPALPYVAVRRALVAAGERGDTPRTSADIYSYATAYEGQPIWGAALRAFPKPDAELFPGLATLLLAILALAAAVVSWPHAPVATRSTPVRAVIVLSGLAAVAHLAAVVAALLYRRVLFEVAFFDVSISNIDQLLLRAAALASVVLVLSPRARTTAASVMRGPGFFACGALAAAWLSLGPAPMALGRPVDLLAPYALIARHVPGLAALDAPARFAMIGALMLAVLGGMGAAVLLRWRHGKPALAALALFALAESVAVPMQINAALGTADYYVAPSRVFRPARAPAVYHRAALLPADAAVAELPLGDRALDARAVYYSTVHWRRLLNGTGEQVPGHYDYVAVALSDVPRHTAAALDTLRATGVTHVVVHEEAYREAEGSRVTTALLSAGAVELFRDGGDVLLQLPA